MTNDFRHGKVLNVKQNSDTKYCRKGVLKVVNTPYLEEKIRLSGKKKQFLAEKIGCTRQYLMMKVRNNAEFNLKEVGILCKELGISVKEKDAIFFAKDVTNNGDNQ